MTITLDQANTIISAALAAGREQRLAPLAVMVLDGGAHPVAFSRDDGASLLRFDIARAKAAGALGMGADSRVIAARAAGNPGFYQSVVAVSGGRMALSAGGVLIRDGAGALIGAVGISGDTGENDERCACAGIVAAGLFHGEMP